MYKEMEGLLLEQPNIIKCHLCGKHENLDEYNQSCDFYPYMEANKVCYSCAFWQDRIANPSDIQEVIGGHLYIVNPMVKRPENVVKGYRGKEIYVRRFDGTLIKTNNIWHIGPIPEHFREYLPDTANFLRLMIYQRLKKHPFQCKSKGCWDRYHCIRYDLKCDINGQFNKIPNNHVIGSEKCRSFINIKELKICL